MVAESNPELGRQWVLYTLQKRTEESWKESQKKSSKDKKYVDSVSKYTYLSSTYLRPSGYYKSDILSLSKKIDMDGFTSEGFKYLNALGR